MSLTPAQEDVWRGLAERLAASDPELARRLSAPPPAARVRPVVVLAVLLVEVVAGFLPLVLGVVLASPVLVGFGVITTAGTVLGTEVTLARLRRGQRRAP